MSTAVPLEASLSEEHAASLRQMEIDLRRAGIPASKVASSLHWYAQALKNASAASWRAFYRELYHAVLEATTPAPALVAILNDDLGVRLFDEAARARIRNSFAE